MRAAWWVQWLAGWNFGGVRTSSSWPLRVAESLNISELVISGWEDDTCPSDFQFGD